MKEVEYQIPALDAAGKPTGALKSGTFTKTIYDPKIITDEEVLQLGQIAAANGYEKAMSQGLKEYSETIAGIDFRVYVNDGSITNVFPEFKL